MQQYFTEYFNLHARKFIRQTIKDCIAETIKYYEDFVPLEKQYCLAELFD